MVITVTHIEEETCIPVIIEFTTQEGIRARLISDYVHTYRALGLSL